jgi:hypothetical protein
MRRRIELMRELAAVTILNVLISLGFSIVGLLRPEMILPPGMVVTGAATTFALYAGVRSLVLAGLVVAAAIRQDLSELRLLATFAALVQFFDAGAGIYQQDPGKVFGPLAVAALQAWVLARSVGVRRQT